MSTHATFGHMRTAAARKSSSGRVYSCAAAETMMTASAAASAAVVAAPCADPRPPTPGVSTSTRPPASRVRGMPTSAWRRPDRLPGFPASDTYAASSPSGTSVRSGVPLPSPTRTSATDGVSACRTMVTTDVATSSSTGHTGADTREFTSWLLPCLNSPTTSTRTAGSFSRSVVRPRRAVRSGRW